MYGVLLRRLAAFVCVAALAGCATAPKVYSFIDRGADLNRYRSYGWGPADKQSTGDPRLDNNEIVQQRIQALVEAELASRGFNRAAGSPDLLVHYHASVEQRIDLQTSEPYTPCPDCKPFIYEAGTLVVDLVDARTGRLVWRGWAEGSVEGVIDNQQWLEERLADSVRRIFATLPRAQSSARR